MVAQVNRVIDNQNLMVLFVHNFGSLDFCRGGGFFSGLEWLLKLYLDSDVASD